MSDLKSKLPDLKELGEITSKLLKDIKNSVTEIITGYKAKRSQPTTPTAKPAAKKQPAASTAAKPKVKATTTRAKKPAAAKTEKKEKE